MLALRTYRCRSAEEWRDELGSTLAVHAEMLSAVLDLMAARCALPDRDGRTQRIRALIDAQAWTDAALAIVDLDHARTVRQLGHDDGEWYCGLGSRGGLPDLLRDRG